MMSQGKKEQYKYLQYEPPPPEPGKSFPWGLVKFILFLLIVAGAGGGYYYYFVWLYRLPQVRQIQLAGQSVDVQLEARNRAVVKYTLVTDHSTHYASLGSLAAADRDFVLKLKDDLPMQFPLDFSLDLGGSKTVPVRLEGRSADWLQYTVLADSSTHYLPLATLKANDQDLVRQLPESISATFPLVHTMSSLDGEQLPERILGRSRDVVKLGFTDGRVRYFPFNDLTAVDQKLVQLVPENFTLVFPYECVLTDNNGQEMNVRMEGRAAEIIKYVSLSDNLANFAPLDNFCAADREIVHLLPAGNNFTLPLECTLTIAKGKPLRVRVEARSPTIVKYTLLDDGLDYYVALSSLSADDQKVLQATPTSLRIRFPFKFALTLANGKLLDCTMEGRNNDGVKVMLADNKTYVYQLSQLSEINQEFLKLVPANLNDLSAAPDPADEASAKALELVPETALNGIRKNLGLYVEAYKKMLSGNHGQFNENIDSNVTEILNMCKQANAQIVKLPKSAITPNLKSLWDSVMQMILRDDRAEAELSTASTSEKSSLLSERRANRQEIISLLDRVHSVTGQYTP